MTPIHLTATYTPSERKKDEPGTVELMLNGTVVLILSATFAPDSDEFAFVCEDTVAAWFEKVDDLVRNQQPA